MRILYVEDNAADADLTRRWLARRTPSATLDLVATCGEALGRLTGTAQPEYDVVLTDLRLPDGSGLSLVADIRAKTLPVAVVVITGAGDEETAVAALRTGADDYIVKRGDYLDQLPLTLENAVHRHGAETARRARRLRVLYAEHSPADADLTRRHFERHAPHLRLDVVATGSAALERLRAGPPPAPDVVLLDYRLPGLNGLDALKTLRQEPGLDLPILLVTGQGDEEVATQALKLGATGYIIKTPGYLYRLPVEIENAHVRADLLREQVALRESQERLRGSEARTRAILRAMPDLVFLQTPDGVYLDCQARDPSDLPLPPEAFLGRAMHEVLPPVLARALLAGFTRTALSAEPQVHEYTLPIEGEDRHFEARMVRTDDGNVVTVVRNVTERARAAAALGESHRHIAELAGRLITSQEGERARLARELHDDLSQQMTVLLIRLRVLRRQLPVVAPHEADEELARLERQARDVAERMRGLSHELHPAVLHQLGLAAAVRAFCDELARSSGLEVEVALDETIGPLPPVMELCLYRVVQEGLRNAARHSRAPRAAVRVARSPEALELDVTDEGVGFDRTHLHKGLGLVSIEERVRQCGGTLTIDARPGAGTRVRVHVPLPS